jgi:hypothetical protein
VGGCGVTPLGSPADEWSGVAVWRPPVHSPARLPKRSQAQAVVQLYGALTCRLGSTTAQGGGAVPWSNPKKALRVRKSEPRNRGNDLLRAQ